MYQLFLEAFLIEKIESQEEKQKSPSELVATAILGQITIKMAEHMVFQRVSYALRVVYDGSTTKIIKLN